MLHTTRGPGRAGSPPQSSPRTPAGVGRAPGRGWEAPVSFRGAPRASAGTKPGPPEAASGHPAVPGAGRRLAKDGGSPGHPPDPTAPAAQVPARPPPQHPRSPPGPGPLTGCGGWRAPRGRLSRPARSLCAGVWGGLGFSFPSSRPLQLPLVIARPASQRRED